MKQHECFIAMLHDYENTDLVTRTDLKKEIESRLKLAEIEPWRYKSTFTFYDYCDFRTSVDLTRFMYCPICGKKIDWKKLKKEECKE